MVVTLAGLAWASGALAREITGQKEEASPDDGPAMPRIGLAFPVEVREGKAVLSAAILVNGNTVLPGGTVLYTLYRLPDQDDEDMREARKKVDRKQAYGRSDGVANVERRSAAVIALEERAFKTKWNSDLPFRAMLNLHGGRDLFLVAAGAEGVPVIHPMDWPEGLLLWDRGQGPEVAWVLDGSAGQRAGFQRGDRIVAMGGKPVAALADFQREYAASRTSRLSERGLPVEVELAGGGGRATRELRAPASLMGSFLEMPME